ncbi:MAG: YeeE/YedE family protein [Deltaproteobacteria bacterium]|nr:MAG: YeeE/YedE family protein [Deltaproteobacteria bacterium]
MENFTPFASTIGGLLIGLAVAAMLLFSGRITGISGIYRGALTGDGGEGGWRFAFVGGLVVGGLLLALLYPGAFALPEGAPFDTGRSVAAVGVAGLLVGFGTRLGSGCTSGHGICGISRFSQRSIIATVTFMATGAVTVFLFNHVL